MNCPYILWLGSPRGFGTTENPVVLSAFLDANTLSVLSAILVVCPSSQASE
ncbi:MAG TPA: hypothetical protein VMW91_09450 [Desulfosporosinus sp.]|nr:hypothetical protein [Desulfosporosinus sp.]